MSIRVSTTQLISGAIVVGNSGLGVLAQNIPASGDNGPGFLYSSLTFPTDTGREVRGFITTWPAQGVLKPNENSSFSFTGPDGTHTFQYQLYVDGVAAGAPQTATVFVGPQAATGSGFPRVLTLTAATGRGVVTMAGEAAGEGVIGTINLTAATGQGIASSSSGGNTGGSNSGGLTNAEMLQLYQWIQQIAATPAPSAAVIANAIWSKPVADVATPDSVGSWVATKLLTIGAFVGLK